MAGEYKATLGGAIITRVVDNASIPVGTGHPLYLQYLADIAAGATLLPADPPGIVYSGRQELEFKIQATGTAPAELVRLPLTLLTGYKATVEVVAIDAGNGVMKTWDFKVDFKRLNNGALAVGPLRHHPGSPNPDVGAPATTSGVANWTITPSLVGNDAVLSVVGHTGRTVDWFAFVSQRRFTPGGS